MAKSRNDTPTTTNFSGSEFNALTVKDRLNDPEGSEGMPTADGYAISSTIWLFNFALHFVDPESIRDADVPTSLTFFASFSTKLNYPQLSNPLFERSKVRQNSAVGGK